MLIHPDVLQQAWRLVHACGAAQALSDEQLGKLRSFASDRMRERPEVVVDSRKGGGLRASFERALDHAAIAILNGSTPE